MMNLVELGTTLWFEHENRTILSNLFVALFPLPQGDGSTWYSSPFQEWTDSSASMHSIIGGVKGKPYVLTPPPPPKKKTVNT